MGIMKKIQWAAGIIFAFSVITAALISSFEIGMYSDFGYDNGRYNVCDEGDDGVSAREKRDVIRDDNGGGRISGLFQ